MNTPATIALAVVAVLLVVAVIAFGGAMVTFTRLTERPLGEPDLHEWIGWTLLDEPGISDVYDGRYARALVHCTRCGETRQVWHRTDRAELARYGGCPGVRS